MRDPYQILGVTKSATADEIKGAYRKLAKKLHPDVNPGRKEIEQKFKEVTAAYDLLSDAPKRARYDHGEIDAQGNERGYTGGDPFGGRGPSRSGSAQGRRGSSAGEDPFAQFSSAEDIFAHFMGGNAMGGNAGARGAGGRGRAQADMHGGDVTYSLSVAFTEAALGGKRRVTLSSGKTIDVTVPPGTDDGDKLRLRGQGAVGPGGGGDAIIEIRVEPHPFFTRKDSDINLEVPISLAEAVAGASIKVPTLDGQVSVKAPKGSNSGTTLRLKGKGISNTKGVAGDMYVKLKIMLPDPMPDDLAEMIEKWGRKNAYDPRKKLGWT
jgi:DnaJ-class molecular chaperone